MPISRVVIPGLADSIRWACPEPDGEPATTAAAAASW
jgi:hypothetical protein